MTSPNFGRLIRFKNPAGETFYGEVDQKDPTIDTLIGTVVPVYNSAHWAADLAPTNAKEEIAEVQMPLVMFFINTEAFNRCLVQSLACPSSTESVSITSLMLRNRM